MKKDLEKAQDMFLGTINQMCRKFGLNNIMAQLYAVLYLRGKPLSLDDMVTYLKISKGSASVNIRALERYGVVAKVWVKGSRKDYYEAEANISKVVIDRIKSIVQKSLSDLGNAVKFSNQIVDSANPGESEDAEEARLFKERLDALRKLQSKVDTLFNMLNSGILDDLLNAETGKSSKKEVLVA